MERHAWHVFVQLPLPTATIEQEYSQSQTTLLIHMIVKGIFGTWLALAYLFPIKVA
jgi:hypothetical protein